MSASVLVVDDEPLNLEIISEYLDGQGYALRLCASGEQAWSLLDHDPYGYDLILLDRMMPQLDGMGLLSRIKGDDRLRHLPVIMQTAAASPEQVREGLAAGAYYYLIKPFEPEALMSIVRAALSDRARWVALTERIASHSAALGLVTDAVFTVRSLNEADALAGLVAMMSDKPEEVAMGLSELLVNGIEHGNLGIDFDLKAALKHDDAWHDEIERRLLLPENAAKCVTLRIRRSDERWAICITDEGEGFNWHDFLDLSPERAFAPNGRGIALSRQIAFQDIQYQGRGNIVEVSVGVAKPVAVVSATESLEAIAEAHATPAHRH